MLAYKFYPAKYAIEALKKQRLKVSPIDELNDPFEYLSIDMGEKDIRSWAREFRKFVSDGNGIISFSEYWTEPLLWSHYADSHRGIALGFDIPDYLLYSIDYISKRIMPPLDVDENLCSMHKLVEQLLGAKHKNWEYEREVRLVRPLKNCISNNGLFFAPLNHTTVLKKVILGARYTSQNDEMLQISLENNSVEIITSRAEFTGFKMTPQKRKDLQKKL